LKQKERDKQKILKYLEGTENMVLKPMAQYLHNPEDQQGAEIFSCCAGVSWKQLGKKNPSAQCYLQM